MAAKFSGNTPSSRQLKVAGLIRQAIIDVLQRGQMLDDKLVDVKITVSHVKMSPDLKVADCFVLPFANSKISEEDLINGLNFSRNRIRSIVNKQVKLKFSPEIRFHYDHSFAISERVNEILNSTNNSNKD